jgi:hypothetical protein
MRVVPGNNDCRHTSRFLLRPQFAHPRTFALLFAKAGNAADMHSQMTVVNHPALKGEA